MTQKLISFITKFKMSNINSSSLLLQWANGQWKFQGNNTQLYNYSQLKNTPLLYNLLQKVSIRYFETLNHLSFDFMTYFAEIERYLLQIEGRKLRRSFKRMLIDEKPLEDMLKIVLYLVLQSQNKNEYIDRIFIMPVQTQAFLMEELKKIDNSHENYTDIKDILATVEKLQDENEELREKLKGYNDANNQLQEVVTETRQQNQRIQREMIKYESQKKQVFDELNIVDMQEYIEIYKSSRRENQQLIHCIEQTEERKQQIQTENIVLKEQIGQNCQTISTLHEQIQKAKSSYNQVKEDDLITSNHSFQDNILRQNKNITNIMMTKSLETSCSIGHTNILCELDQQEISECQKLRNYNRDIMDKLQSAYKLINKIGEETNALKDDNDKLIEKNKFLERKIKKVKKQQNIFLKQLKIIGF